MATQSVPLSFLRTIYGWQAADLVWNLLWLLWSDMRLSALSLLLRRNPQPNDCHEILRDCNISWQKILWSLTFLWGLAVRITASQREDEITPGLIAQIIIKNYWLSQKSLDLRAYRQHFKLNLLPIYYFYGKSLDMHHHKNQRPDRAYTDNFYHNGVSLPYTTGGKETPLFHVQCYAIERHFQEVKYYSPTSALFVPVSHLNQWENGFYCVTVYPLKKASARKQLSGCDIQRFCVFDCLCWIYLY